MSDWIERGRDRIRFDVRLTPAAGANGFAGLAEDSAGKVHLKARVTAIAEKNKANDALVALVAKALKTAKGTVTVVAGQTSRVKTLEVAGDAEALSRRLSEIAAGGKG